MVEHELTARGYGPPSNRQYSVFLENRCGRLLELLDTLAGRQIRVVALSVVDSADYAVVRLVTTNPDQARVAMREHEFSFTESDILVVELPPDQTFSKLCTALLGAELNIHHAYPLMVRPHGTPTIALHCDDIFLAGQILHEKHFILLGELDLEMDG